MKIDADFCVLGPVRRGHGDAAPLGWDSFAALASQTPIPVYALGGMKLEDLPAARRNGAQGIALISDVGGGGGGGATQRRGASRASLKVQGLPPVEPRHPARETTLAWRGPVILVPSEI